MNDLALVMNAIPDEERHDPETQDPWIFPTSFAQRRLWFIDQVDPGNSVYNVPGAFRIHGRLDPGILERSFAEIIARHEILRTTFRTVDGEPMQIVAETAQFHLPVFDLRALPSPARESEVMRIVREKAERPFNLREGPLFRAALIDAGPLEQVLVLCLHDIITDCWSQDVLMRELTLAYSSLAKGDALQLPELGIQYADYAAWQRDAMHGEILQQELTYWRARLAGLAPLEFPPLPPSTPVSSPQSATLTFELPEALAVAVRAMAHREGVTLFMALLACWKIFLAQYTGRTDIAVGAPISHRSRSETAGLIGYFLNTLLLRTDLSGDPTSRQTLLRIRDTALEAFGHQNIPFEMIAEELQPAGQPARNPLLRVMFVFTSGKEKAWRTPDGDIESFPFEESKSKADLMLQLRDTGSAVNGAFVYNKALFDPAMVRRIAAHFETLLAGMAAHPDAKISSLPLASPGNLQPLASASDEPGARLADVGSTDAPESLPLGAGSHAAMLPDVGPPPSLASRHPHENPATWMEGALMEIWQEVLDCNPIGVTDDFFDLGGDSILAMRMLAEVENKTGIKLSLRLLFEKPTIRHIALAARRPGAVIRSAMVAVQSEGPLSPLFFLHGDFVEGGLYCVKMARSIGANRPFYAIDPHGVYDAPPNSIEEMAAERIELIRQVRPKGPYVLGGFCNGALVAFEMARQLEAAGEHVSSLIMVSADGSNSELSWLERLIGFVPGRRRKFDYFLQWRERILFLRAAISRQFDAMARPVPISQQPGRILRKAGRIVRKALGLLRARPGAATMASVDTVQPEAAGVDIGLIYQQACMAYVPRAYKGPAHLLWPSELSLRDPSAGWASVMPQIKVLQVPGGHFSSLQGPNLQVISEEMRRCLRDDQA